MTIGSLNLECSCIDLVSLRKVADVSSKGDSGKLAPQFQGRLVQKSAVEIPKDQTRPAPRKLESNETTDPLRNVESAVYTQAASDRVITGSSSCAFEPVLLP